MTEPRSADLMTTLRRLEGSAHTGAIHLFRPNRTAEIALEAGQIISVHLNHTRAEDGAAAVAYLAESGGSGELALRPGRPIDRRFRSPPFGAADVERVSEERLEVYRRADRDQPEPRAPGVHAVERSPEEPRTIPGSLEEVCLWDLLDMLSKSGQAVVVELEHERRSAEISVERGYVTGARVDGVPATDVRGAVTCILREWRVGRWDYGPPLLDRSCMPIAIEDFLGAVPRFRLRSVQRAPRER
ncbi:MAG TPA: DUF4388 domain-containing protein [Labilithrix sp.]|nr:DUF4388 domain-containing protein [Labilithrix sp.]